ncbi:MAG: RND family transporter [Bacteroidales bacterium]|nr:RND family transporter [Bacteroidales bacterium]
MNENFWIYKHRKLIVILSIVLFVLAAIPLIKINIDTDLRKYFPEKSQSLQNTAIIEDIFGTTEPILLLFEADNVFEGEALERFQDICYGIEDVEGVDKLLSFFSAKRIYSDDGFMMVDPAIPFIPMDEEDVLELQNWTKENSMVYGNLVSKNFKYAFAMIDRNTDADDKVLLAAIDSVIEANPGKEKVLVAGEPQLRIVVNKDVKRDLYLFLPVGIILMLTFLWISFRNFRAVMIPLSVVLLSIIFALGLLPIFGWPLSLISLIIPVMMFAISNNYGIHFVAGYIQDSREKSDNSSLQTVKKLFKRLKYPVLFTGLTTIAGILTMLTHVLIPARQTGVSAAWGIFMALLISLILVPLMLIKSGDKIAKSNQIKSNNVKRDKLANKFASIIVKNPKRTLLSGVVLLIVLALGIIRLSVDPNVENVLPKKHDFLKANHLIDNELGGSKNFTIMVSGDIQDPEVLRRIDTLENELKAIPHVGGVLSIANITRTMSKALLDPSDELYGEIPDTKEAIAQMFFLYSMGGDPSDFEQLVDFNYENAAITVQFRANEKSDYKEVFDKTDELIEKLNLNAVYGGYALMNYEMVQAIVKGQIYSLSVSIILVFVLLLLIFKSWKSALLGCVPLSATIVMMFGLMGYLGVSINVVTALISSIVVGIGVDYAIHFISRYKFEMNNGLNKEEAIYKTLTTTGRGIIINSTSVILGFIVLVLSSFVALQNFAIMMITALFLCLLFSLTILPAVSLLSNKKNNEL